MNSLYDSSDKDIRASNPNEVFVQLSFKLEQYPNFPDYLLERYTDQEITPSLADIGQMIKSSKLEADTLRLFSSSPNETSRIVEYDEQTFLYGAMLGVFIFESLEGKERIANLSEAVDKLFTESHEASLKYPSAQQSEAFFNSILGTAFTESEQRAVYLTLLDEPRIRASIDMAHTDEAQDGMAIILAAYQRL